LDEAGNSDNLKGFYFFPKNKTAYYKPDGEIEKFGQKVGCRQKLGFLLDMDEGELTFYLDGKPMEKPNMIKHDRLKTEKFNMNCIASYDISSYSNYWILEKPPACHYISKIQAKANENKKLTDILTYIKKDKPNEEFCDLFMKCADYFVRSNDSN